MLLQSAPGFGGRHWKGGGTFGAVVYFHLFTGSTEFCFQTTWRENCRLARNLILPVVAVHALLTIH